MAAAYLFSVAQTSKSTVSRVSKPAGRNAAEPTWKSAIQQAWKPALQNPGKTTLNRYAAAVPEWRDGAVGLRCRAAKMDRKATLAGVAKWQTHRTYQFILRCFNPLHTIACHMHKPLRMNLLYRFMPVFPLPQRAEVPTPK